jgi:gliding motility-associated-like protein
MDNFIKLDAGRDTGFCYYQTGGVSIGNPFNYENPYTYSWSPVDDLSNPNGPQTIATPSITTNYTLTITSPTCGTKTDIVTVNVYNIQANAGADTAIVEGSVATLHASPNDTNIYTYWWEPSYNINYQITPAPDVFPKVDTTYALYIIDKNGCVFSDKVKIEVIPSDIPVFFNTMTPNNDGNNDIFYIGNLEKYPENKLEIYNRYGQLIYSSTNYQNDWNGTYFGKEVPDGTYFFVFDTKGERGKFKGSVTLMR